jgi:hypothetical protein
VVRVDDNLKEDLAFFWEVHAEELQGDRLEERGSVEHLGGEVSELGGAVNDWWLWRLWPMPDDGEQKGADL